ncbi:MAG: histidinol dehydrogenase, partial [Pseudomonadota bacterium]|nr:histidinol dehydrogenase [Pseudomonadota bacterium]
MLRSSQADFEAAFGRIVRDRRESDVQVGRDVAAIINEVRERGDDALADYTARFDSHGLSQDGDWQIDLEECRAAYEALDSDLRDALETAANRIRAYHEGQLPADRDYTDDIGMRLGARWNAVDAAGLYVPGGRAAYPSSLLMNAIPAKVAGVQRLVVTTPTPKGEVNPLVLAAAHIAGVDEIWRVGGAQAVAALAYGTNRIAKVDVIAGPGNAWVAEAKRQLYGVVGIDMVAGPSEILVIADANNDPEWIAADLLSQAEHDPTSQSILITDSEALARQVEDAIDLALMKLPTAKTAKASWEAHGLMVV